MGILRVVSSAAASVVLGSAILATAVGVSHVRQISPLLPDHETLGHWSPPKGTRIIAADGTLMATHEKEYRTFAPIAEVPALVVNAFIAAEDARYWEHSGVDPAGILRAAVSNLTSLGDARPEGGSTITQQVVKNVILSSERTFDRKLKEAILAIRADRDVGKQKILEVYLNHIYFGAGAYGVAAASNVYFGKSLPELNIAEAALLAGLPKAPSAANPFVDPRRAKERRAYVLRRMREEGFISVSQEQASALASMPVPHDRASTDVDHAMWFPQEAIRRSLVEEVGSVGVYEDGTEVVTTIIPEIQRIVHAELRRGIVEEDRRSGWRGALGQWHGEADWSAAALAAPNGAEDWSVAIIRDVGRDAIAQTRNGTLTLTGGSMSWASSNGRADSILSKGDIVLIADFGSGYELTQLPEVQGALIVMDPNTGAVLATSGGFSHESSEFDRALQARRQTGSVFKPFVYLAAVEKGYDAMSPILDSPIALEQSGGNDWRPQSGNDGGLGLITLRRSLELSRNMSTVRLLYDIGLDAAIFAARRAGMTIPDTASYSMALGAAEATPMEVARAYSSLANGGFLVIPHLRPENRHEPAPVFDPISVAQISSMLEGVVTHGTGRRSFEAFPFQVAGKTGTTNNSRDVWMAAYGPGLVVVGWMGRDDFTPLEKGASGGSTAAPMVRRAMERSAGHVDFPGFALPAGARTVLVDRDTGMPDPDGDVVEIVR